MTESHGRNLCSLSAGELPLLPVRMTAAESTEGDGAPRGLRSPLGDQFRSLALGASVAFRCVLHPSAEPL